MMLHIRLCILDAYKYFLQNLTVFTGTEITFAGFGDDSILIKKTFIGSIHEIILISICLSQSFISYDKTHQV